MERVRHYINNTEIYPVNGDDIGFKLDWTGDPKEAELNVDTIELANDAKALVLDHIVNGPGFWEGIPYSVEIGSLTLQYYIDLTENARFNDSTLEVNIKRRKAVNYFFEQADVLSFELIDSKVGITNFVDIPYVVIKDNQLELLILLSLSTYSLTKALIEGIKEVAEALGDIAEALPPVPGNAGDIVALGIRAAARIIYTAALIIALINVITELLELIFPPIRKFKGSYFRELIRQGVEYLGYDFQSTLLESKYDQLAHLPVPLVDTNPSIFAQLINILNQPFTKGYPTANDTTATLGSLIRKIEEWLNGETRIIGNTVYIEDENFWYTFSSQTVINTLNLQDIRENSYTFNFDETWKRYYLHYQLDIADTHTLDRVESSDCEYSTEPINVVNSDLVTIKGLVDISVPFALGIRKNSLTFVETIALVLAQFADSVINFFGGNSNLAGLIQGRIGVLQISSQYFSISKALWISSNGRQPANYLNIIGANAIYEEQHVQNQVRENFKRIYTASIPFSDENFLALLNNNVVYDQEGNQLEILNFEWTNESRQAEITYTIFADNEATNIETILING